MHSKSLHGIFVTPWTIWDSPGKNTGVGCHALLQWIFLTQGLNLGLLCLLQQLCGATLILNLLLK